VAVVGVFSPELEGLEKIMHTQTVAYLVAAVEEVQAVLAVVITLVLELWGLDIMGEAQGVQELTL
jgi:hypothetical protein